MTGSEGLKLRARIALVEQANSSESGETLEGLIRKLIGGNLMRQRLADTVDLIVMTPARKAEELSFEVAKP